MRIFLFTLMFLFFLGAVPASSWQGRMEAMSTPYGFTSDESDFLIHPSLMAGFGNLTVFTHFIYRFEDITSINLDLNSFPWAYPDFDVSGHEQGILTTSGAVIPLGMGNLGMVFSFHHQEGEQEGKYWDIFAPPSIQHEIISMNQDFIWSLLYAMPATDVVDLGVRVDISYLLQVRDLTTPGVFSNWLMGNAFELNPQNRRYGQADLTLSGNGDFGPYALAASLHGGFIFSGSEEVKVSFPPVFSNYYTTKNNVHGWNIGGDIWLSYELDDDVSFPFTLDVEYEVFSSRTYTYTSEIPWGARPSFEASFESTDFSLRMGAGVDYHLTDETRLGAVLSYTYHSLYESSDSVTILPYIWNTITRHTHTHGFDLNLNAEIGLTDSVALVCGLDLSMAAISMKITDQQLEYSIVDHEMQGYSMGMTGGLGLRAEFDGLVLEPYVSAGMSTLRVTGDTLTQVPPAPSFDNGHDAAFDRNTWFIATGITLAYDGF